MRFAILGGILLAALAGPVSAHHSFAAYYFEDRSVTIEGELVKFEYVSPHTWVHVDVMDQEGVLRRYAAEWSNPNRLAQDRITKDTFKAGDRLIITGSPGRVTEEYKIHLKRVQRPSDGLVWPVARRGDRR